MTTVETQQAPAPGAASQERVERALQRGLDALFARQRDDGHWCAELEGDSILNSEYLLMKVILGQDHPDASEGATPQDVRRMEKMCVYLRWLQREDGTWGQYPGAAPDLSATVKAYYALKLFGDDPQAPHMRRAREATLALGGAERINTFSMFYLACLGQVSWNACPAIPPEVVFLPRWFPFHLDKVAAWTRTMVLPLAMCSALRPVRRLPAKRGVDELFLDPRRRNRLNQPWDRSELASWTNFFLAVDRGLKTLQRLRLTPGRRAALDRAEAWLLERMTSGTTDGLGAIFPPMVYIQVALQARGYPRSHPIRQTAERELDRFIIEEEDHIRIQPCFSPVWDTGTALYAVTEAGGNASDDARVQRACDWLCQREVRITGDWVRNLRRRDQSLRLGEDAAAWAFEYRNDWYPDVDDTAMVAMALRRAARDKTPGSREGDASRRAVRWLLAMQNDDGGWAAFDRTKDRPWMEAVPFADHNAMQDPSCPDITGRTLEALVTCGVGRDDPAVRTGVEYLLRTQREAGWWPGRWGVNALYGTWQAVGGLAAAGVAPEHPAGRRTLAWLRSCQNDDGGFGETADSYVDERLVGVGPSTPSQTAWGVMTLMRLAAPTDPGVQRAIDWLCASQLEERAAAAPRPQPLTAPDSPGVELRWALDRDAPPLMSHPVAEPAGSWREGWFTGTGFPKVFYLRYHLYRVYFPVMALAQHQRRRPCGENP